MEGHSIVEVSAQIAVTDTSKTISQFSTVADRLYNEFAENLINQYSEMRNSYMTEYQHNFELNKERKAQRIQSLALDIEKQEQAVQDLKEQKEKQKSCLATFFKQKVRQFQMRYHLSLWKQVHKIDRRKNRIAAFTRNTMHRRKMKHLFESWRGVSHTWFKHRLEAETGRFRAELEEKMLNCFTTKVDALNLYMAQLT